MPARQANADKRVPPYTDPPQKRIELVTRTFEYHFPFNYENIEVRRVYDQGEFHGMEINSISSYWPDPVHKPADCIIVSEDLPIVQVVIIGSACTPPGYVTVDCEPDETFRRPDEVAEVMPVRFRADNLWGMHLRFSQWARKSPGSNSLPPALLERLPSLADYERNLSYRSFPLSGMSCAIFEIPASKKVLISGGSQIAGWYGDGGCDDAHYSFRMIRTTVVEQRKQ